MPIPFWDDNNIKGLKQGSYNLSQQDRVAINSILDPMMRQGQVKKVLLFISFPILLPAFIVWSKEKS